jgi:hypothetical protein
MSDSSVDEKVSSTHHQDDALDLESVDPAAVLRKIDLVLIPCVPVPPFHPPSSTLRFQTG